MVNVQRANEFENVTSSTHRPRQKPRFAWAIHARRPAPKPGVCGAFGANAPEMPPRARPDRARPWLGGISQAGPRLPLLLLRKVDHRRLQGAALWPCSGASNCCRRCSNQRCGKRWRVVSPQGVLTPAADWSRPAGTVPLRPQRFALFSLRRQGPMIFRRSRYSVGSNIKGESAHYVSCPIGGIKDKVHHLFPSSMSPRMVSGPTPIRSRVLSKVA